MKRNIFLFCFIISFFLISSLWGMSIADFDKIVDFSITLEEMSKAIEEDDFSQINKNKFVILSGIASVIRPDNTSYYLLKKEDIKNPSSFISVLKKPENKISRFLFNQLSYELQERIIAYNKNSGQENTLLNNITREFKNIVEKEQIYDKERFSNITLSAKLRDIARRDLSREEKAFVNRLLIETVYPAEINKVSVQVEIVYGVWIGYDEVKSYKSIIEFKGLEAFKIFKRKRPQDASGEMIPINSTILIVAKIIKYFTLEDGEKGWFLEGLYLRGIQ